MCQNIGKTIMENPTKDAYEICYAWKNNTQNMKDLPNMREKIP